MLQRNICQSCAMPMSKDKQGGGSETDGSKSTQYCSYCYADGLFLELDLSCEQMCDKVKALLMNMKVPGLIARRLLKKIPKLARWTTINH